MDRKVLILVFLAFSVACCHGLSLEEEEDLELERQLKLLNRPPIKTIQGQYGDLFDCIDINKQPAFDNPLLANHKIQMNPQFKEMKSNVLPKNSRLRIGLNENESCPMGTVPIRRTSKEELLWARSLPSRMRFNSSNGYIYHVAMLELLPSTYYGVQARISTNAPTAMRNQFTSSSVSLTNGLYDHEDIVQAGWMVNQQLFGNLVPRLFVHWMVDGGGAGCYNFQCSGYVQISRSVAPGSHPEPVCVYDGEQYDLLVQISKDVNNTGWFLTIQDEVIGYWPLALFKTLNEAAASAQWGGEIFSPSTEPGPQMGSGQFPEEGYRRVAYQRVTQAFNESQAWFVPNIYNVMDTSDKNDCYRVVEGPWDTENPWFNSFFFGGPGGCKL